MPHPSDRHTFTVISGGSPRALPLPAHVQQPIIKLSDQELKVADRYVYWDARVKAANADLAYWHGRKVDTADDSRKFHAAHRRYRNARRWARYWALQVTPAIIEYVAAKGDEGQRESEASNQESGAVGSENPTGAHNLDRGDDATPGT